MRASLHATTPLNELACTIIDREPICRWRRTHRSGERFSRRKSGRSWLCRRSVGCTTATSDELPERAKSIMLQAGPQDPCNLRPSPSLVPAHTSAHRLKHRLMLVKPSRLRCIRGYNIPPKRYGIERDNQWCNLPSLLLDQRKETVSITMCHGPA